jgi:hypothetical protein
MSRFECTIEITAIFIDRIFFYKKMVIILGILKIAILAENGQNERKITQKYVNLTLKIGGSKITDL